jgi:hypothetical protein
MVYRGPDGFTWRAGEHGLNTRVIAAITLIAAGWAVGFFSGRMSAWVFPVANPDLAALKSALEHPAPKPPIGARSPSDATPAPAAEKERPSLALSPAPAPADQDGAERADTAKTPSPPAKAPEQAEPQKKPPQREAVLVNPEWTATPRREREPEADPVERNRVNDADIAECERRYSSFRASDGTYQPYGRNSRVLCPFLR